MDFLIQNWYLIVAVIAVLAAIGFSIYKFAGLPTAEQKEKIMAWLLYAVTKAEAEFGSGTGQANCTMSTTCLLINSQLLRNV